MSVKGSQKIVSRREVKAREGSFLVERGRH